MVYKKESREEDSIKEMPNQPRQTLTPRQVLRLEPVFVSSQTSKDVDHCAILDLEKCSENSSLGYDGLNRRVFNPTNRFVPLLKSTKRPVKQVNTIKKYRRSKLHKVKKQEYKKLREMVPALKQKERVSKVVVIEEAIKYIDELHCALVQRFKSKQQPTIVNGVKLDPNEVHGGNIRDLIRRLLANANPSSLPPTRIENIRTLPSFLQKISKHKKSS